MEVKLMRNILGANDEIAALNRKMFAARGVVVMNLMGSPGSGKTTLLENTLARLVDKIKIAVIEGDLFTAKDAERIERLGVDVIQINTAGGCHLDAAMIQKACTSLDLEAIDLLIVENVGNLVCPAEFDIGENFKAVVLSITEGDDKPLKYPLIFKESEVVLLNKVDLLPFTNFDLQAARTDLMTLHPTIKIFETSCTKGTGLDDWAAWLLGKAAR
ncbi:MAG: hydrogenase nickel incorporation protein HypB [Selenomonadaceae bacterium]|nr:hydrogenase nickel incorporation protein HypB [Selenomonadaceae bacterium]MBQ6759568.1 hydrogenase nickel incorporation protein HypB [Selenomonadaceae bacterium]